MVSNGNFAIKNAPGGNRTHDNPAPETGALSTELQVHAKNAKYYSIA